MRIRSRWNRKDKERSPEEQASVLGFIIWRIACNAVLNLENEGFQTDTQRQRLDVIGELVAYLLHVVDRLTFERLSVAERERFIGAVAQRLLNIWHDNLRDALGPGDHRQAMAERLNARMSEYAELPFGDGEPGFAFNRYLGACITEVMGPRDNRWILDQVMAIEVPEALQTLRKALRDVMPAGA
ncbi:hypothetical protein HUS23_09420 [Ectothiorhodospiraceae bacterium 2226]|nr:hypothetical protein HUS23_09420 [Ectothiorhodospiraceae bacterium 2226]